MLTSKERIEVFILNGREGYIQRNVGAKLNRWHPNLRFIPLRFEIKTICAKEFKMSAILFISYYFLTGSGGIKKILETVENGMGAGGCEQAEKKNERICYKLHEPLFIFYVKKEFRFVWDVYDVITTNYPSQKNHIARAIKS